MELIKHFGLLQFKPGVSAEQVATCFRELGSLVGRIPGLRDFCHGSYSSPEGLNDGYTHGFIMTFESPAARDAYLSHPEHERVKELVLPWVQRVVVFDFEWAGTGSEDAEVLARSGV
jgi:hypothetical protein